MTNGMMESDLREAQIKRSMAMAAQRTIALVDHSKFGEPFTASSLLPEEIDAVISNTALDQEYREQLVAEGTELELV